MSTPARHLPTPDRRRQRPAEPDLDAPIRVVPRRGTGQAAAVAPAPAKAEARDERAPLVVVPRYVRRRRAGVAVALGLFAVFALMLGLVAFQAKIAQDQLNLDHADRDLQQAEATYSQLRLQVASLEAPDRVIAEAKKLGLVRPAPTDMTYLTAPPAIVGEVLAAGGIPQDPGPSGTADAQDWSAMKPLLRGGP
jgi:cell division protein FtsL